MLGDNLLSLGVFDLVIKGSNDDLDKLLDFAGFEFTKYVAE
jgi:hypothetical protein